MNGTMKQLPTRCSGCGQLLYVDVADEYDADADPLGIIQKLLKAVRCDRCLSLIPKNNRTPLKLPDTRQPYVD